MGSALHAMSTAIVPLETTLLAALLAVTTLNATTSVRFARETTSATDRTTYVSWLAETIQSVALAVLSAPVTINAMGPVISASSHAATILSAATSVPYVPEMTSVTVRATSAALPVVMTVSADSAALSVAETIRATLENARGVQELKKVRTLVIY